MPERGERILIVDDSVDTLEVLRRNLETAGYLVFLATGAKAAVEILEERPVDLIVVDLKMPEISGLELARFVQANLRDTEVLMVGGDIAPGGDVEPDDLAVTVRLARPFTGPELLASVHRALDRWRLHRSRGPVAESTVGDLDGFVAEGPAMRQVTQRIREYGDAPLVFISGEAGTGRRKVARLIHSLGSRRSHSFLELDCVELDPEQLDLYLLGGPTASDRADARAGARALRPTDGGTVHLANAHGLTLPLQTRIALAIEAGDHPTLILSTEPCVERLRERFLSPALRRRFSDARIELPPLREREADLPLLVRHHIGRAAEEFGLPRPEITDPALDTLCAYSWPGNVVELRFVVRLLASRCEGGTIDLPDIPASIRGFSSSARALSRPLEDVEFDYIRDVLEAVGGNRSRAAEILKIDRKTLRQKLRRGTEMSPPEDAPLAGE